MEGLRKQFMTEFENIAAKILDDKTKNLLILTKTNLESILSTLSVKILQSSKRGRGSL